MLTLKDKQIQAQQVQMESQHKEIAQLKEQVNACIFEVFTLS